MFIKKIITFCTLLLPIALWAQTFEIMAVNKGAGVIGIQMRQTGSLQLSTSNYITDIVFGIKWSSDYNVDLGEVKSNSYNITKSDVRKLKGNYYFQAFYANNIPFLISTDWSKSNWTEILSIQNSLTGSGVGLFEICEQGFDLTTDPNIGIDLVDYTPKITGSASGVSLPIGLLNFIVAPQNKQITATWQTSSEVNNKGFIVQRSVEGTNFDSIGWQPAKGSVNIFSNYLFVDKNVKPDTLYYYRLQQQDVDGNVSYSAIRSAKINDDGLSFFRLSPNPVVSALKINYYGNIDGENVNIKIIDTKGLSILTAEKNISPGMSFSFDLSLIASGEYYLIIKKDRELLFNSKFIKL